MIKILHFTDLRVWREAHDLTASIYRLTDTFPRSEMFGLTAQIRSSAASVDANIAEGKGRKSIADFKRFLIIARGSVQETINHLLLAKTLGYIDEDAKKLLIHRFNGLNAGLNRLMDKLPNK